MNDFTKELGKARLSTRQQWWHTRQLIRGGIAFLFGCVGTVIFAFGCFFCVSSFQISYGGHARDALFELIPPYAVGFIVHENPRRRAA